MTQVKPSLQRLRTDFIDIYYLYCFDSNTPIEETLRTLNDLVREGKVLYIDLEEKSKVSKQADIILVSHSHYDHCDLGKIKKASKENTIIIAPIDCESRIKSPIKAIAPGVELSFEGIKIHAVDAYNNKRFRSLGIPFHPKGFGVGFIIEIYQVYKI